MNTTDNVVYIHHEADWSSTALVSWHNPRSERLEIAVEARLLWDADADWLPPLPITPRIAMRAVRLATLGRARWEHDQVLSRPVPGRRLLPWDEGHADNLRHDPTDAWLFDTSLCTENAAGPRVPRRPIPLGWIENVAVAMFSNVYALQFNRSTSVLIDIGAPHRDPCTCGRPVVHDRECPQADTFPRIGFIETLRAARTSVDRIFVP